MNTAAYTQIPAAPGSQPAMGLGAISLFVEFNSPSDFQSKTGDPLPAPNPSFGPKHWADPAAAAVMGSSPYSTFTYTAVQADGTVGQMSLPAYIAGSVNFFPSAFPAAGAGDSYSQMLMRAAGQPMVPLPIRPLDPTREHLQASTIGTNGGNYIVMANVVTQASADGFTNIDRTLLQAIAAKLGV